MREWLAFQCGQIFLLFFNLCGMIDADTATGMLAAMFYELLDNSEDVRSKTILKLAPYIRRDEAERDKFSPGR